MCTVEQFGIRLVSLKNSTKAKWLCEHQQVGNITSSLNNTFFLTQEINKLLVCQLKFEAVGMGCCMVNSMYSF